MDFRKFTTIFSQQYPISVRNMKLHDRGFALQQLHVWEKKGWIHNIIRGWWILPKDLQEQGIGALTANMLYEPSYLSMEWALRYYNLIPEGVYQYISCTTKKTQVYETIVGYFSYRSIHARYYWGYNLISLGKYSTIRIASPEKALCDYIYLHPEISSQEDFIQQRINPYIRSQIASDSTLLEYVKQYPIRTQLNVQIFLDYIHAHA